MLGVIRRHVLFIVQTSWSVYNTGEHQIYRNIQWEKNIMEWNWNVLWNTSESSASLGSKSYFFILTDFTIEL